MNNRLQSMMREKEIVLNCIKQQRDIFSRKFLVSHQICYMQMRMLEADFILMM